MNPLYTQYVNPFVKLLQQLQCGVHTLSGVEKFHILAIYYCNLLPFCLLDFRAKNFA